ncbi:Peptidyl-prolyl isomerase cwc27 [Penicillium diatomitis]|uniref:Peptidyl-prolyl isomerase CWC27 n=1 Tax=Penicillium diatomitis TaxID=2819901 RepID=A0A9W9WK83_9EURO|nr:Peptidyl-prolyl isomerase cwc27 [Penicillium diatomitis]KAJ5466579.1 Peptidyl-prolyl isomerase cwc27 [Penicillium diatomitis]
MSTQYASEPNPTASATLHTTIGPIHIALFAKQAPLTCKNFLQHCKDNYYAGTIFHRIVPDFVVQGGDPTGTGSGGTSIYEYPEFEYDPEARDPSERVVLRDEIHSRLRFNRRGQVGMAKSEDGSYGSQFFITLGNTEREMNGQCTLFGRLEGDSIFNVLKIAEADRVEGTERPLYPVKVISCQVGELGPLEGKLKDRKTISTTTGGADDQASKKKNKKKKATKVLLSFGDDEGEEGMPIRPAKPKFNTKLVADVPDAMKETGIEKTSQMKSTAEPSLAARKRPRSPSPNRPSSSPRKQRIKTPEPHMQLPLPNPESPSRSPSPVSPPPKDAPSKLSRMEAEIASLKASMRRNVEVGPADTGRKKSALEAMIPETATRGRKRPAPGSTNGAASGSGSKTSAEKAALDMFNAFKAKLEGTMDPTPSISHRHESKENHNSHKEDTREVNEDDDDEEAQLCDLHFIANCQSCKSWDDPDAEADEKDDIHDQGWLNHTLRFGKDTLGKDLNWKKEHPDDADSLMVIDPREKEKDLGGPSGRKRGLQRDRERERKRERAGEREWDRAGK